MTTNITTSFTMVTLITIISAVVGVGVWAGSTGSDLSNHVTREAHPEAAKRLRDVETKVRVIESDLKYLKEGQTTIKDGQKRIEDLLRQGSTTERLR